MSSNRLIYDKCAYATEIKESTGSLEYNLFLGKFENCTQCLGGDFTNNLPFGPKTQTESELLGLTRPNTKCPSLKYDAKKEFKHPQFSPARVCEGIHYITPSNLTKPNNNMLNYNNMGINFCSKQ
jgi:hypothetical protein